MFGGRFGSALAAAMLATASQAAAQPAAVETPALTVLKAGAHPYWSAGEFTRNGLPIDAPQVDVTFNEPVAIMTHEVTANEYRRCVDEKVCAPAGTEQSGDVPVVMVNWNDAEVYADWLSRKLGGHYRLPTDEEWTYAAGSRAPDERQFKIGGDAVSRWISRFDREANAEPVDQAPQPTGYFGRNENGLLDVAGNVWEWTSSCYTRTVLDVSGKASGPTVRNCGVRIAEGRHRAYVSDFIRDPRGGGCAAGVPPSNLGFRLVQENKRGWSLF
jgi:formylglycine-generating enzyme required for sulfatase activity